MKRRDFLKLLLATGAGMAASQIPIVRRLVATHPIEPRLTDYEEKFFVSACGFCPMGCSVRVRMINGFPVSVRGNPEDPRIGGGLCPKGLTMLQQFYHPDRLQKPLKRSGPRGSGKWEVVEWDEALTEIANVLKKIRKDNPEGILFLNGRPFGLMDKLVDHFMHYLGSPHHIPDHYIDVMAMATTFMMGAPYQIDARLEELDYLVLVGAPILDYTMQPAARFYQYGHFREQAENRRVHMILFDDTRGVTAEKADAFYRIHPGTYTAILLALANVIVRYDLYDKKLVQEHVHGFDVWKQKVLVHYTPEEVENLTGVSAAVLYDTAQRLARSHRKLVLVGEPALYAPGGLYTAMAMLALNMLLGVIDHDLKFYEPIVDLIYPGPVMEPEKKAKQRLGHDRFPAGGPVPWLLPELIESAGIQMLMLYYSNPVASHPDGERWRQALGKIDYIISFSPFLDETTEYADWILPDSHFLERYQDFMPPPAGYLTFTLSQPFRDEPLYDTRHTGDVLLDLVRRVDDNATDAFPWETYQDLIEEAMIKLYHLRIGTLFRDPVDFTVYMELARRGYQQFEEPDEDTFIEAFYERGGWVQPIYIEGQWGRLLRTPSGKFEITSTRLKERIDHWLSSHHKTLADIKLDVTRNAYYVPVFIPPDFHGSVGKVAYLVTWNIGNLAELPWWWEVIGMHRYQQWVMWAEVGTDDPEQSRLDVPRKPMITLEIRGKRITLPVVYRLGGHKDVIQLPAGYGRKVKRSTPLPLGPSILALMPYNPDPLTGIPSYYFPVKLIKPGKESES